MKRMPAGLQPRIWQGPPRSHFCNQRTTTTFHHTLQSTQLHNGITEGQVGRTGDYSTTLFSLFNTGAP